jgi:uroporphyrin-III C-methyltransferase/precorrin-2 dehydrogenase/sirohydrochlorin ferrochelatase
VNSPRKPLETNAAGLAPLAVLPVFVKLEGRRAVLAGGIAGAAWKAKLLAAAGAAVDVYAPEPSEEMRNAPGEAVAGSITLHERGWTADDLGGATVAIAAGGDEGECIAFCAAARAAGAIVNAVDRPHLCDVQFGAIVNRSPLVVGISTDGAAPVFGQAIRSRIETLLPRGFAAWVAAAKGWRERVSSRLDSFRARRDFWERFSNVALAEPHRSPDERDFADLLAANDSRSGLGSVTLVGAGPGDPELLTLKAMRALRAADVILYDDLVAPAILDYARREARTTLVGKTGHGPSCRQDEINALMLKLARDGKRVVRLKGGDPLIFGRAGEEIEACRAAGVRIAVIPGVTSAQGAAAELLVSLTHRSCAKRVQFVTGHDWAGTLPPNLNWAAITDPGATTVIYMPKRTLASFLQKAIAEGLSARTPAVAVYNATRTDHHAELGTAATLASQMEASPTVGPATVLIGEALAQVVQERASELCKGHGRISRFGTRQT